MLNIYRHITSLEAYYIFTSILQAYYKNNPGTSYVNATSWCVATYAFSRESVLLNIIFQGYLQVYVIFYIYRHVYRQITYLQAHRKHIQGAYYIFTRIFTGISSILEARLRIFTGILRMTYYKDIYRHITILQACYKDSPEV
jgi:hypothetical protein